MKYSMLFLLQLFSVLGLHSQINNTEFELTHGTTILTMIMKDTIWMAVDRKVSDVESNEFSLQIKIHETNNIYYSFAGLGRLFNIRTGDTIFYAPKVMENVINKKKAFVNSFNEFNDLVIDKLKIVGNVLRNKNEREFKKYFHVDTTLFEVMMVGFVDEKPYFISRGYGFKGDFNNWKIEIRSTLFHDGQPKFLMTGQRDHIEKFLAKNENYFLHNDYVKKLVCLIEMEAKGDSTSVAMPADVLILYKNGHRWNLNNKRCLIKQ